MQYFILGSELNINFTFITDSISLLGKCKFFAKDNAFQSAEQLDMTFCLKKVVICFPSSFLFILFLFYKMQLEFAFHFLLWYAYSQFLFSSPFNAMQLCNPSASPRRVRKHVITSQSKR